MCVNISPIDRLKGVYVSFTCGICVFGGKLWVKQDTGGLNKVETEKGSRGALVEEGDFLRFLNNYALHDLLLGNA